MSKQYGFGIVGCGVIAGFHARAIADLTNGRLVAAYSRSPDKARVFAGDQKCRGFSDYEAFLACPDLDIVAIATPSGCHLEPAVAAARAGKHVLCEKPLEITLERTDEIIRVCRENKVGLSGLFPRRFTGAVEVVKAAVDAGRLGQMTLASAAIKWFRSQEYYDSDVWRRTWSLSGGGALMSQSIHTIDLLLHFAGDVQSVCAFAAAAAHRNIEIEDVSVAAVQFANGAFGTIEGTTTAFSATGHPAQIQLCGTEGSIFMADSALTAWDFKTPRAEDAGIVKAYGAGGVTAGAGAADPKAIDYTQHRRNIEDFLVSLETGLEPRISGAESRRSIEFILAIYESAMNGGRCVTLPLERTPVRRSLGA